jgi:hypothetical protein
VPFTRQLFRKGDRVAWTHRAGIFHHTTVMSEDALRALFPADVEDEGERLDFGTVTGCANTEKTYYDVKLDSGDTRTLTFEELTKVSDA